MIGIEKTTVRINIKLPDNTAKIQRLYDYGAWFSLQEEYLEGAEIIADFLEKMKEKGAVMSKMWEFVDDDDLKEKQCVVFEYTD